MGSETNVRTAGRTERLSLVIYSAFAGCSYGIFAVLQLLISLGDPLDMEGNLPPMGDLIGALVLFVVGALFARSFFSAIRGKGDERAYLMVGTLLGYALMVLYLLIIGSEALSARVIGAEGYEGWRPIDGMRPALYLGVIPALGTILLGRYFIPSQRTRYPRRPLSYEGGDRTC